MHVQALFVTSRYSMCVSILCVVRVIADINECARNKHDCDVNAGCTNNEGSFTCHCNEGYTGDGRTCVSEYENSGVVYVKRAALVQRVIGLTRRLIFTWSTITVHVSIIAELAQRFTSNCTSSADLN